jgi:hypothetical protein
MEQLSQDIEVMHGNNTYLVRFVDGQTHILMPALGMDCYAGDAYLDEGEKQYIVALALNTLVSA